MRRKKRVFCLSLWLLMTVMFLGMEKSTYAEEDSSGLDLIVVMDNSGSMISADSTGIVRKAVKMLINMMPAVESRIGLIGFNTEPTVLTVNTEGKGDFISLDKYQNAEAAKAIVEDMVYSGDTAIGNALMAGVELLETMGRPDAKKAMILFTDGVDDLGSSLGHELKEEENNEKFQQALLWAQKNNCPIYSLGFNYITSSGNMSMGEDGEGLLKLKRIQEWTGGSAECTEDIVYIEQIFTEMLADICDVRYVDIGEIPGDGELHETEIDISPSVMEANIRINCSTEDALGSGTIRLLKPDGSECILANSDTVRYDLDATAASIKLLVPESGTWILQVEGITGDNIKVGLLEHNNLQLETILEVPTGNEANTAFLGDTVKIKARIIDQDNEPVDEAIYGILTLASAEAVPRTDEAKSQTVQLTWQEQSGFMEGEFNVDTESIYDIYLSIQSERFFYEDAAELLSSNQPLQLIGEIPDQEVDVKTTLEIPEIYSCVDDLEGDPITAVAISENEDKLEAVIDEDSGTLFLEGKKWGSSNVTVHFTDQQNNSVSLSFHVKVKDFWKIVQLNMAWIILAAIVALLLVIGFLKARIITGNFIIQKVTIFRKDLENPLVVTRGYKADVKRVAGRRKTMAGVLKNIGSNAENTWPPQQYKILKSILIDLYKPAAKIRIKGTWRGKKGILLKAPAGLPVIYRDHALGAEINAKIKNNNVFSIEFCQKEETRVKFEIKYSKK